MLNLCSVKLFLWASVSGTNCDSESSQLNDDVFVLELLTVWNHSACIVLLQLASCKTLLLMLIALHLINTLPQFTCRLLERRCSQLPATDLGFHARTFNLKILPCFYFIIYSGINVIAQMPFFLDRHSSFPEDKEGEGPQLNLMSREVLDGLASFLAGIQNMLSSSD